MYKIGFDLHQFIIQWGEGEGKIPCLIKAQAVLFRIWRKNCFQLGKVSRRRWSMSSRKLSSPCAQFTRKDFKVQTSVTLRLFLVCHSGRETRPWLKDKEAGGGMQERKSDKPERQTSWSWSKSGLKMKCMAQSRTDTLKIRAWLALRDRK